MLPLCSFASGIATYREYLSSGEKRAGWADLVTSPFWTCSCQKLVSLSRVEIVIQGAKCSLKCGSRPAQRFPYLLQGVNTLASGVEGVLFVKKLATGLRTELKIRSLRCRNETYHKMHSGESNISI